MIVCIIISILATIAIAKFSDSKQRAYLSTMKADLRNLATTAESKYASDNSYAGLVAPRGSAGVRLIVISEANEWSATATHAAAAGVICTIGSTSIPGPNQRPQPDCR